MNRRATSPENRTIRDESSRYKSPHRTQRTQIANVTGQSYNDYAGRSRDGDIRLGRRISLRRNREHYNGPVGFAIGLEETLIGGRLEDVVEMYTGAKIGMVRGLRRRNESNNCIAYYAADFRCETRADMDTLLRCNEMLYKVGSRQYKFRFGETSAVVVASAVYKGPEAQAPTDDLLQTRILKDIPYSKYDQFKWQSSANSGSKMIRASMTFKNFYEFLEAARSCTQVRDMKLYNNFKIINRISAPLPAKLLHDDNNRTSACGEVKRTGRKECSNSPRYRVWNPRGGGRLSIEQNDRNRSKRLSSREHYSNIEREEEDERSDIPKHHISSSRDGIRSIMELEDECVARDLTMPSSRDRSSDDLQSDPSVGESPHIQRALPPRYENFSGGGRKRSLNDEKIDDGLSALANDAAMRQSQRRRSTQMNDMPKREVKRARLVKQERLTSNCEDETLLSPPQQSLIKREAEDVYDEATYNGRSLRSPEQHRHSFKLEARFDIKQEPKPILIGKDEVLKSEKLLESSEC